MLQQSWPLDVKIYTSMCRLPFSVLHLCMRYHFSKLFGLLRYKLEAQGPFIVHLITNSENFSQKNDNQDDRIQLDRGCPNGTNTPRGDNFSRYQNLHCDLDLWPFDLKIYRAHPCLMGSLHVKFHDDRCKGKAVMRQKPFSVIYALWPWPLTFWPQNL